MDRGGGLVADLRRLDKELRERRAGQEGLAGAQVEFSP